MFILKLERSTDFMFTETRSMERLLSKHTSIVVKIILFVTLLKNVKKVYKASQNIQTIGFATTSS